MFGIICIVCIIMILFGITRAFTGYGIIDGMVLIAVAVGIMVYFSNPSNLTIGSKPSQNIIFVQDIMQDDDYGCQD